MRSMTGFGTGEGTAGGATVTVDLRSVNHRFLDLAVKLPPALVSHENEIRGILKENLARGRITFSAQLAQDIEAAPVVLDQHRLNQGMTQLETAAGRLADQSGRKVEITLDHLLKIPDLFRCEEIQPAPEEARTALLDGLQEALAQLLAMKEQEGRELVADLNGRLVKLRGQLTEVERLAPAANGEAHERLQSRLTQLLQEQIEPQRLAQEAAFLAERSNINEECERLTSHLQQFEAEMAGGGQAAKRLNFLLQEMHREVNTIGSKTASLAITQLVIAMKDEVESMREQVQNLE